MLKFNEWLRENYPNVLEHIKFEGYRGSSLSGFKKHIKGNPPINHAIKVKYQDIMWKRETYEIRARFNETPMVGEGEIPTGTRLHQEIYGI